MPGTNSTLTDLAQAILDYDPVAAERLARQTLDEGIPPTESLAVMTEAIREVGDAFGQGDAFLPDLIGAATALEAALPVLKEAVLQGGGHQEARGVVVLGTVKGDVHTIGKGILSALLTANGFDVHDLGVDVPAAVFVGAVQSHSANVVAMSALLTSTALEMEQVMTALEEAGLRDEVFVVVGGGAVTKEFAASLGADAYHPTAPGGVELIASRPSKRSAQ